MYPTKKKYEEIRRLHSIKSTSWFSTQIDRNRAVSNYARKAFPSLMDAFSTELWRLGYMERVGASPKRPSKERMRVPDYEAE